MKIFYCSFLFEDLTLEFAVFMILIYFISNMHFKKKTSKCVFVLV